MQEEKSSSSKRDGDEKEDGDLRRKKRGRPRKEGERDTRGRLKRSKKTKKSAARRKRGEETADTSEPRIAEEEEGLEWEMGEEAGEEEDSPGADPIASNQEIMKAIKALHASLRGQAAQPEEEENADETLMNPMQRLQVIRKIQAYRKSRLAKYFSDTLKKQTLNLESKRNEELMRLEKDVTFAVYEGMQPRLVEDVYFTLLENVEKLGGAEGLAQDLREGANAPHLQDLLTEVGIKYQNFMEVEPEWRLGFITLNCAIAKRRANRELASSQLAQPAPDALREELSKL
jgi:hypothetical protein